jgi:hypothetical protein
LKRKRKRGEEKRRKEGGKGKKSEGKCYVSRRQYIVGPSAAGT